MSEITPTDLIHRPSTINFSRGSCCYAYPARGECPAPVALQVSCDNNNRTVHHNLYMPVVLFVLHARSALCSHRQQSLRRAPTTAGRRAPAPPAPEQGAPSICAPIPDAHDLAVRIIHSIVFPHPITALCPHAFVLLSHALFQSTKPPVVYLCFVGHPHRVYD